ncbi:DUF4331 domain-containing protein [Paractinoplanes atraurantiacus]|uniref:DUF4331 domain-containing protein n=1 Tax=Paractinoplanes atraurantiacus TaxID=1036182 RepID=A0A285HRS6_9ACTN|nr:DUF4331 domain-containing protein [Actinoplanes atraurantiacus]SNY37431.1 protein of unknown function [Actinoplanes atraurantiacus]
MIKRSLAATGAAVLVVSLTALGPGASTASSHREAPLIASDPAADNTDLYAFVSPDRPGYVTMIANWIPFEEPDGGPNFYPFATDAAYRINVDSDGDAKPDAVFRWTFKNVDKRGNKTFLYNNGPVTSLDDKNLLFKQTYTLESSFDGEPFKTRISDAPVAPSRIGAASMPDYKKLRDQATVQLKGGWKLFAGQADDPFFLDLEVFDSLYGGDLSERGNDTLAGYNVNSLAIQVPFKDVALKGDAQRNPVIGVWTTTERNRYRMSSGDATIGDDRVQVSRLGNPLVNEVVVPAGLKDAFNSISPDKDAGIPQVVKRVTDPELPKLIEGIYKVKAPPTPRNDLVEIYLTGITTKAGGPIKADLNSQLNNKDVDAKRFRPSEMLRLNLGVPVSAQPERLGVLAKDLQGFPNGRRLTDDVLDISLQAVEGAAQSGKLVDALADGDKVDANDNAFGDVFPYVALPNQGAVNADRKAAPAAAVDPSPSDEPSEEPAPDLTPAAASAGLSNSSAVLGGVLGAVALVTMLTVWWLMRRRRLARPSSDDDTILF